MNKILFTLGAALLMGAAFWMRRPGEFAAQEMAALLFMAAIGILLVFMSGAEYGHAEAAGRFIPPEDGKRYEVLASTEALGGTCYAVVYDSEGMRAISISLTDAALLKKMKNGGFPRHFIARKVDEYRWEYEPYALPTD